MHKMKLENLSEFLNHLNPNKKDFNKSNEAMNSLTLSLKEVKDYLFWNEEEFTRNLISKTEVYEVYICCWLPGQSSKLHDLNGQLGWTMIIDGSLDLTTSSKTELSKGIPLSKESKLNKNDVYVHPKDDELYSLANNSNKNAISIHLISLPISFYNATIGNGNDVEHIKLNFFSINGTIIN